jgi:uncharacterized alkaline shock family protein YloU
MSEHTPSLGETSIDREVLTTIARLTTLGVQGVAGLSAVPGDVNRLFNREAPTDGVRVQVKDNTVSADIYVIMNRNVNVRDIGRTIQKKVSRAISEMVGMHVGDINIHIEDIEFNPELES